MGLRQQRLADEIRDILATTFMGGQLSDPRLGGVSITHVKVSSDLQVATVYYRLFEGGPKPADAQKGLESASGYLRKQLAVALDIRRVPTLRYFYDESVERGARIEQLLSRLD